MLIDKFVEFLNPFFGKDAMSTVFDNLVDRDYHEKNTCQPQHEIRSK
jgi:hypothetical protein